MTDTFCSRDDVAAALHITDPDEVVEGRLDMAALLGTAYVNRVVSGTVDSTALTLPYDLEPVDCPPAFRAAATVAAVRYYSAADVPFGVVSVGDYGKVINGIPEADMLLVGHRTDFGIG